MVIAAAPTPALKPSASSPSLASAYLCLDALRVVLNDHNNEDNYWLTSTVELQMVSLQVCVACRSSRHYHICIPWGVPGWMWAPAIGRHRVSRVLERCAIYSRSRSSTIALRRIPSLKVRGLTWGLSTTGDIFLEHNKLVAGLESLVFGDHFNDDITEVVWPRGLIRLAFGRGFNQPVAKVVWPVSLRQLTFGDWFNRSLDGTTWSGSLQQLSFGDLFNKPIRNVTWPPSLRQLSLGFCFDRPIADVAWPASLQDISFGHNFNRPIHDVSWPASLRHLFFENSFNHPVEAVLWPPSVQEIRFGTCFNQPIRMAAWPGSLRRLTFGRNFQQQLMDQVEWPASLEQLTIARRPNDPLPAWSGVRIFRVWEDWW